MSAGDVAGLIAAVAFVLLVGVLAVPLLKLGQVLEEARVMVRGVSERTTPLLEEVTLTVSTTNTQLARVDTITSNVAEVTGNVSAMTSLFAATLGNPVIKVAAFTYGVRKALAQRDRAEVSKRVRQQMKAERSARRGGRRGGGDAS